MKPRIKFISFITLICILMLCPVLLQENNTAEAAGVYDAQAAANYALTYAKSYNPAYRNLGSSGENLGGDCTNFVSQSLCAGGIQTSTTWAPYTRAWTGALSIKNYFVGELGYELISQPSASQISVGDIMWYDEGSHVCIVTSIVDGVPHVCGHTTDVRDSQYWKQGYSTYGVIKMNGSSVPTDAPAVPAVSVNKKIVAINEDFTINFWSEKASYYWVGIYKNNVLQQEATTSYGYHIAHISESGEYIG